MLLAFVFLCIPASFPSNPTGEDLVVIRRRLAEAGPRQFFQDSETWQATGGLRGDLANAWHWEAAVGWGKNTAIDGSTNVANLDDEFFRGWVKPLKQAAVS